MAVLTAIRKCWYMSEVFEGFLQLVVNAAETSSHCCKCLVSSSLSQLCTGACVFPRRWEIRYFVERCSDVGKGESILTVRNWNTTQSILTADFFLNN